MKECCKPIERKSDKKEKGFLWGILLGILPHSFCIAFIIFTVIGSTIFTAFFRKILLTPYFFQFLIGLSFILATVSAVIYLKRINSLSFSGAKSKWKYLSILYGITIGINLLFFLVVFPAVANMRTVRGTKAVSSATGLRAITIEVKIPCSGHAPLIISELKKINGINEVKFFAPNLFEVYFDQQKTSAIQITQAEIFKSFPAVIKKDS